MALLKVFNLKLNDTVKNSAWKKKKKKKIVHGGDAIVWETL